MKPSDILASPDKWTKGAYALDSRGRSCPVNHEDAKCFCAIGAINRCFGATSDLRQDAINCLAKVVDPHKAAVAFSARGLFKMHGGPTPEGIVLDWNDNLERTYSEVVTALKTAGL